MQIITDVYNNYKVCIHYPTLVISSKLTYTKNKIIIPVSQCVLDSNSKCSTTKKLNAYFNEDPCCFLWIDGSWNRRKSKKEKNTMHYTNTLKDASAIYIM